MKTVFDERDAAILEARKVALDEIQAPRDGDYVRFADGVERRVSYVTPADWAPECDSVQTSDGGSWYLGHGYTSFSGGLFDGVPHSSLTLTNETKPGSCWFFHHDYATADNGVDVEIPFRVYQCNLPATA